MGWYKRSQRQGEGVREKPSALLKRRPTPRIEPGDGERPLRELVVLLETAIRNFPAFELLDKENPERHPTPRVNRSVD